MERLTKEKIIEILNTIRGFVVSIPDKPSGVEVTIRNVHENLNHLTDLKITIASEILQSDQDKLLVSQLKFLNKEAVDPLIKQLTLTKQTLNMIINKDPKFSDPFGNGQDDGKKETSNFEPGVFGDAPIDETKKIVQNSFDDPLSVFEKLDADSEDELDRLSKPV